MGGNLFPSKHKAPQAGIMPAWGVPYQSLGTAW